MSWLFKLSPEKEGRPIGDRARYEELRAMDQRRQKVIKNVEEPSYKILLHWDGTVVSILAFNPLLWTTMAMYILMLVFSSQAKPSFAGEVTSSSLSLLGGFLTFFLVFYVNHNHRRYFQLYEESMGCKGSIFNVATMATTTLPFAQATRLIRYMNAAHAAGYVGLSSTYPTKYYFNHIVKGMGILTQEERNRLDAIDLDKGGNCNRELIVWCMNEIAVARRKGLLDQELAMQYRSEILRLRTKIAQLYDAKDLPIPFFYVHFICLLTTFYLPLFAVISGIEAGVEENYLAAGLIKGFVVLLQAIFVIGLRVLGQAMSDPYGEDIIDLSVSSIVEFVWINSNRILNSTLPEEASNSVEALLIAERNPIGNAWEIVKRDVTETDGVDGYQSV